MNHYRMPVNNLLNMAGFHQTETIDGVAVYELSNVKKLTPQEMNELREDEIDEQDEAFVDYKD